MFAYTFYSDSRIKEEKTIEIKRLAFKQGVLFLW